jgi:hypothetical protein
MGAVICQSEAVNDTVEVAIVGMVGTLTGVVVGPWFQTWWAGRREQDARLRDSRASLYSEAMLHAQFSQLFRDGLVYERRGTTEDHRRKLNDARPLAELITARMWLIAPKLVCAAWEHLLWCEQVLDFDIGENHPEAWMPDADPTWTLPEDYPTLAALTEAIAAFRASVRQATGVPD